MRLKDWLLIGLGGMLLVSPAATAAELRVAAASSAQEALQEVATRFEAETGHRVTLIFGSSGKFAAQLTQGAPFDCYFSADDEFPAKLFARGLVQTPRRYARGRLVLWTSSQSPLELSQGLTALGDPRVRKVSLPNPKVAPYGRAAVEAVTSRKLDRVVSPKLVLGENVAQATQFVQAGGADVGLLPLSMAISPKLKGQGKYWLVPEGWHSPIVSDAAVVRASRELRVAQQFLDFATSARLQSVWRRFGLADR